MIHFVQNVVFPLKVIAGVNGDFLFWTQTQVHLKTDNPRLTFYWETHTRLDDDSTSLMEVQNNPGFIYKIFPWFALGYLNGLPGEHGEVRPWLYLTVDRYEVVLDEFSHRGLACRAHHLKDSVL